MDEIRRSPRKSRGVRRGATRGVSDSVYRTLRDRICLLHYPPGTVLREETLAAEFGVSRTPVRQVLQRLEFERLVETHNGLGTIVSGVDFKSFRDVYEVRCRVAELIGDMSPRPCSAGDVALLEQLLSRAEKLKESRDAEEFWHVNHEMQACISARIGNETLRWIHDLLYFQTARIWYDLVRDMWEEEVEVLRAEVRDVLMAFRADDMRAVGYIRRNYISYGMRRISAYLSGKRLSIVSREEW
ncbi:MAG: GntR family transcriptional regulator [Gammaproteobacteria bacterium]|nr:GntR family transcriptional regulator [Gammaproteobacteria bacterium]NIR82020.1 GntR family transcriptional regulator [Gammaproteobacteria bacterium]NIR89248.1 GntR family transcriptional regulator [Gammaproteobacteria bacterium]NIU03130.1 GntR family transcriptional regulator [Gammaproteobacteria bacterium]NIV50646.1 GntR family transcriptional regulator [Gammaproteobacteria bacterium]